ncbi:MAG TPA: hypothetical protein DEO39_07020 [Clostridiales bacterium]|nr:hypothetical protein [Clostridiales bacterium]
MKDTSSKVISEETYPHVLNEESYMEWWDDREVEILPDAVRKAEVRDDGYMQSEFYASVGEKVYFIHEGERSHRDTEPCVYRFLSCYDIASDNKSELWCVDLFSALGAGENDLITVKNIHEAEGKTKILFEKRLAEDMSIEWCEYDVNTETGEMTDPKLINIDPDNGTKLNPGTVGAFVFVEGKYYFSGYPQGANTSGKPVILVSDGSSCSQIKSDEIEIINDMGVFDDKTIIVNGVSAQTSKAWLISAESNSITGTVDIPEQYLHFKQLMNGMGFVSVENRKLLCWSFSEKHEKKELDYNFTGISYTDSRDAQLVSAKDNQVIVVNIIDSVPHMHTLIKSSSNPHIGKRVIKCAYFQEVTSLAAKAVQRFNDRSNEYYAIIIDDYRFWNYVNEDALSEDATREFNRARGEASTTLMADIVSGKGPDVLLDGSDYREIQSPKYLVDLKGKIDELNLKEDEYFLHVFEMAELEGKEFFIPLQFSLSGFLLTEEKAGDRKGVKISDYQSFVQTTYNGNDPLYSLADRTSYFDYLLGNSFDLFIGEDGKYDFDNSAFREIAQYIQANVPEKINIESGSVSPIADLNGYSFDKKTATAVIGRVLVGIPSPDERGPYMRLVSCAAITGCSSCQDGAWELIRTMLDEDVQTQDMYFPVCRAAFEKADMDKAIEESYLRAIDSCSRYFINDYTAINIINEEIQAYFYGQKSLDDVIATINNRVSLLQNERG